MKNNNLKSMAQKNIIVSHASVESAKRSRSKSLEKRVSNESDVKIKSKNTQSAMRAKYKNSKHRRTQS